MQFSFVCLIYNVTSPPSSPSSLDREGHRSFTHSPRQSCLSSAVRSRVGSLEVSIFFLANFFSNCPVVSCPPRCLTKVLFRVLWPSQESLRRVTFVNKGYSFPARESTCCLVCETTSSVCKLVVSQREMLKLCRVVIATCNWKQSRRGKFKETEEHVCQFASYVLNAHI